MTSSPDAAVLTEFADGVAVITINRPEARNALDGAVARAVAAGARERTGKQLPAVREFASAAGGGVSGLVRLAEDGTGVSGLRRKP